MLTVCLVRGKKKGGVGGAAPSHTHTTVRKVISALFFQFPLFFGFFFFFVLFGTTFSLIFWLAYVLYLLHFFFFFVHNKKPNQRLTLHNTVRTRLRTCRVIRK